MVTEVAISMSKGTRAPTLGLKENRDLNNFCAMAPRDKRMNGLLSENLNFLTPILIEVIFNHIIGIPR